MRKGFLIAILIASTTLVSAKEMQIENSENSNSQRLELKGETIKENLLDDAAIYKSENPHFKHSIENKHDLVKEGALELYWMEMKLKIFFA